MLMGFVQGYEELKWGIGKLNPLCNGPLRIDNSGRSVIYTIDHESETVLIIITCNIANKRLYFSLSIDISAFIIKCD